MRSLLYARSAQYKKEPRGTCCSGLCSVGQIYTHSPHCAPTSPKHFQEWEECPAKLIAVEHDSTVRIPLSHPRPYPGRTSVQLVNIDMAISTMYTHVGTPDAYVQGILPLSSHT